MSHEHIGPFIVPPGKRISLKDYDPRYVGDYVVKSDAAVELQAGVQKLAAFQDMLYAQNIYALLLVFQALDAAGKDSVIKHVMTGVNPQGCEVYSFKAPSPQERDHDYLWRNFRALPERGRIGIFNRSYYEETLVVRVHPEILEAQQLPPEAKNKHIWKQRFEQINNFEKYLVENGIVVLKFFLNVSRAEQKERFLERIEQPDKNWKFSYADLAERALWDEYMAAFEDVFNNTSTEWAPWYVIPADRKWFTRIAVANIINHKLAELDLTYPPISEEQREQLRKAKAILEAEDHE